MTVVSKYECIICFDIFENKEDIKQLCKSSKEHILCIHCYISLLENCIIHKKNFSCPYCRTRIQKLNEIFRANEGDKSVNFEVIETEIVAKPIEVVKPIESVSLVNDEEEIDIENLEGNEIMAEEMSEVIPIIAEEVKRITTLEMPSRRLKIKISKELLQIWNFQLY
jgi:hypothetical protein